MSVSRQPPRVKGVVFDLDGTLVDSAADIAHALNVAHTKRGLPTRTVDEVRVLLGTGGRSICRQSLTAAGLPSADGDVEAMFQDFYAAYLDAPVAHTKPFPGTLEGLAELQAAGYPLGVCTNKTDHIAGMVLEGLGMAQYFGSLVGHDRAVRAKPDPGHLGQVATELGLGIDAVALVGDTAVDLRTARAAGVRHFAVAWSQPDACEEGYTTVIGSMAELPGLLSG